MRKLEALVPPPEMCQEIPEGAFTDSALVHTANGVYPRTIITDGGVEHFYCGVPPRPTLAEIMAELGKMADNVLIVKLADGWGVSATTWKDNSPIASHAAADPNPTIAALRVWLSLNDEEA